MRRALLIASLSWCAAACGDNLEDPSAMDGGGQTERDAGEDPQVARGRYLVNDVAQCAFCHTPRRENGSPDPARFLAGVDCFGGDAVPEDDEAGCLHTRNLTNHETGLANASDEEIKQAFQHGIGTDGRNLFPLMPYWVFTNMTDEDADAVVAYLRTVPGVDHTTPANQPPFTEPEAPAPSLDPDDIPQPADDYEDLEGAQRGRYLTAMAGVCFDCHTPETAPMSFMIDLTRPLGGGRAFPAALLGYPVPQYPEVIFTANLTQHETGLADYDKADIIEVMKEGLDIDGDGVCAPTHSGPSSSYAGLTDEDLDDIVDYLLSVPPVDNMRPDDCKGPPPS